MGSNGFRMKSQLLHTNNVQRQKCSNSWPFFRRKQCWVPCASSWFTETYRSKNLSPVLCLSHGTLYPVFDKLTAQSLALKPPVYSSRFKKGRCHGSLMDSWSIYLLLFGLLRRFCEIKCLENSRYLEGQQINMEIGTHESMLSTSSLWRRCRR